MQQHYQRSLTLRHIMHPNAIREHVAMLPRLARLCHRTNSLNSACLRYTILTLYYPHCTIILIRIQMKNMWPHIFHLNARKYKGMGRNQGWLHVTHYSKSILRIIFIAGRVMCEERV